MMTLRQEVRAQLLQAVQDIDNNEGFGKILARLGRIITAIATIYEMADQ